MTTTSSASSSISEVAAVKTMQQLLNEINQVKNEVAASITTLKRIDTGHKKATANRDRLVEGRTQIKTLNDRINDLQRQMDSMRKESDPTWPTKTFDKSKQNALKTLSDLSNKLNQIDKDLEKAIGSISTAPTASTEGENTKGVGALVRRLSFGETKKTSSPSGSDDEYEEEEADVVHKTQEPQSSSRVTKKVETSSEESEDGDNEDNLNDHHQLLNELQNTKLINDHHTNDSRHRDHQTLTTTPPRINTKPSTPIPRETTNSSSSTSSDSKRIPNPQQRAVISTAKNDEDSEDDSDEEDDELRRLDYNTEEEESIHNSEQTADEEPTVVTEHVRELRNGKYPRGTKFRVLYNLKGLESNDLTIQKDEILILIEQKPDDWWLFKNSKTQQEGMVPINHIELQSETYSQRLRHRVNPTTSASTLVDVFKANNYIPSGFIPSNLAPLTQQNKYKLSHTLIPKMTESNFTFTDLHWRYDTEQICIQQVKYQKILTIKKCSKIPRIKGEQIRVLNRCIRVCLYDGLEIISNIHATRARLSGKRKKDRVTENWYFVPNDDDTFIDEQSEFLIRSNEYDPSKNLYLLIELSQLCQSKITQEKCEIGSGWIIISLDDNQSSKNFNELLHGGEYHQTNILLNSQYKNFHSDGLAGTIDRYKKARIRFSIQSREKHLYDNLPLTSMIIPMNLIRPIVFYRNELAYQLEKRSHPDGLSTTPFDSIFLSTFYQTLEQPDLICTLQRLYQRKKELSIREQREEFIKTYELSIYPLLFYRSLPPYDFHDISSINKRRKLISEIVTQQLATKINNQPNILEILLDPKLTEKWTPFTTDEICFSLQKYTHDFTSKEIV